MILDLHGVKHKDVYSVVDSFIWDSMLNNLHRIEIITGKSSRMMDIVEECLTDYGYTPERDEINGMITVELNYLI